MTLKSFWLRNQTKPQPMATLGVYMKNSLLPLNDVHRNINEEQHSQEYLRLYHCFVPEDSEKKSFWGPLFSYLLGSSHHTNKRHPWNKGKELYTDPEHRQPTFLLLLASSRPKKTAKIMLVWQINLFGRLIFGLSLAKKLLFMPVVNALSRT